MELADGQTPIDPNEAEGLIPALLTQGELNRFEAENILSAMLWAEARPHVVRTILTPDTLRELHRRMFGKTWRWAGTYRITQKSLGIEAFRIAPEIKMLCDDVAAWLEFGSYEPDAICARFHHRLVVIHAFPNGNGRHARLATDLLCKRQKWPLPSWGAAEPEGAPTARGGYLAALRAADRNDFGPLIAFLKS